MDINITTVQAVGIYITGLANAVDQKILSVEQGKYLTRTILTSTGLLVFREKPQEQKKEEDAPSS